MFLIWEFGQLSFPGSPLGIMHDEVKNKHDIENSIRAVRLHAMANKGKSEIE